MSVGGIKSCAEVRGREANFVSIEVPELGALNTNSIFEGFASNIDDSSSINVRDDIAGDIDNIVVGVENVLKSVSSIAAGAPSVAEIVSQALG